MKSHEIQLLLSESNKDWVLANPGTVSPRIVKARQIFSRMNPGQVILDVGCADGGILKPLVGPHEIHGVEITPWLVELALKNGVKAVRHNIEAEPLPYANAHFDAVFCGETIEHQVDTDWLMFEINRVLKPGGRLLVLEFSKVAKPLEKLYDWYSFKVLPRMGQLVAGDDASYRYLAESIRMHPGQAELKAMMQAQGFGHVDVHNLTGGVAALHVGIKC